MKCQLSGFNPLDVLTTAAGIGTAVATGAATGLTTPVVKVVTDSVVVKPAKEIMNTAIETIKNIEVPPVEVPFISLPPIKVENNFKPIRLKQNVEAEKKKNLEELISLIPLGGLAMFTFIL